MNGGQYYLIEKTWNGLSVDHDAVKLKLESSSNNGDDELIIKIEAPFFNDPPKPENRTIPGELFNLWDYEVVEAFFLGDDDCYIEVEFGPHGHYIALLLKGSRNLIKKNLTFNYTSVIHGDKWIGEARIPENYFPRKVTKWNAYAIHGSDENRTYEALFPSQQNQFSNPDFHRLELFKPIKFEDLLNSNWKRMNQSDIWTSNYNENS